MSDGESSDRLNGGGGGSGLAAPVPDKEEAVTAFSANRLQAVVDNFSETVRINNSAVESKAGRDFRFVRAPTDPDQLVVDILSRIASQHAGEMEWSGVEPDGISPQLRSVLERAARVFELHLEVSGRQWALRSGEAGVRLRPMDLLHSVDAFRDACAAESVSDFIRRSKSHLAIRRVCVVTPEAIGPFRNGGIGTHAYWLCRELAVEPEFQVTLLYTGPYSFCTREEATRKYRDVGVEWADLSGYPVPSTQRFGDEWFTERSRAVSDYLLSSSFDVVHFQDWQANGFLPVRMKRTGLAFQNTLFTITMHSSAAWIREAMKRWSDNPIPDAKLDYCERYVVENADVVISPSQYMLEWAKARGIRMREAIHTPNCFGGEKVPVPVPADPSHLIYFGRLEVRKGFEVFCEALERYVARVGAENSNLRRITFLGRHGETSGGGTAQDRLDRLRTRLPPSIQILVKPDLDSFEAQTYIRETGGIVIISSLVQDNFPYTVVECLENGFPFLAAKVGGVPEMVTSEVLYEPTIAGFIDAFEHRAERIHSGRQFYDRKLAAKGWLAVTRRSDPTIRPVTTRGMHVSICVAHFNHGRYLPQLLASLASNTYSSFEVVVVDDGSTDPDSRRCFHRLAGQYSSRGWTFLTKENEGLGATRNYAARHAKGGLLVFMDADNLALPHMIGDFVTAMETSGADAISCDFDAFRGEVAPGTNRQIAYSYRPLGPCLEAGPFENVFGDANFCIKRSVFEALGGFSTDRTTTWEDWEFLAKLSIAGYTLDVIPKVLFLYRHVDNSLARTTSAMANHLRALQPYIESANDQLHRRILLNMTLPLFRLIAQRDGEVRARDSGLAARDATVRQQAELIQSLDARASSAEAEAHRLRSELNRASMRLFHRFLGVFDRRPRLKYMVLRSVRAIGLLNAGGPS